jgi:argininosuccinate synthase
MLPAILQPANRLALFQQNLPSGKLTLSRQWAQISFGPKSKTRPSPLGQLTLRNLDIIDAREKLAIHTQSGLLSLEPRAAMPRLGKIDNKG